MLVLVLPSLVSSLVPRHRGRVCRGALRTNRRLFAARSVLSAVLVAYLLLRTDASIAEEKVEERRSDMSAPQSASLPRRHSLWLLETCIDTRLQVAQVREDTLLPFLCVLDWTPECFKTEQKGTDCVSGIWSYVSAYQCLCLLYGIIRSTTHKLRLRH